MIELLLLIFFALVHIGGTVECYLYLDRDMRQEHGDPLPWSSRLVCLVMANTWPIGLAFRLS